jgi:hypothetical protein
MEATDRQDNIDSKVRTIRKEIKNKQDSCFLAATPMFSIVEASILVRY